MVFVSAILLGLALAVLQLLHGGIYFPALALPGYLLVAASALLAGAGWWKNRRGLGDGVAILTVLATFGWLFARQFFSPDLAAARQQEFLLLAGCSAFFATASLASWKARTLFLLLVLATGLGQWAVSFFDLLNPEARVFPWASETLRGWYEARIMQAATKPGFYMNVNHLAWLLNACALISLGFGFWSRWPLWVRLLFVLLGLLFFGACGQTASRAGVFAGFCGLAAFGVLSGILFLRKISWARIAVAFASAAVFAALVLGVIREFEDNTRLQSRLEQTDTFQYREALWRGAIRQWQISPLFGTGAGTYESYFRRHREPGMDGTDAFFAHNDWLQLAAEYGVIAFLLTSFSGVFLILSGAGASLARSAGMSSKALPFGLDMAVLTGGVGALVAFAAHGFFDFNMQIPANAVLAMALAGMMLVPRGELPVEKTRWGLAGGIVVSFCAMVGAAFLLFGLLRIAPGELMQLRGSNALARGEVTKAYQAARDATLSDPENARAWQLFGDASLARSLYPMPPDSRELLLRQAYASFQRAALLNPGERMQWIRAGESAARLYRPTEAYPFLAAAVELESYASLGWAYLGSVAELGGDYAAARRFYSIATRLPGRDHGFSQQRLRILRAMEDKGYIPPSGDAPSRGRR
jgi:O-antigen ligase